MDRVKPQHGGIVFFFFDFELKFVGVRLIAHQEETEAETCTRRKCYGTCEGFLLICAHDAAGLHRGW